MGRGEEARGAGKPRRAAAPPPASRLPFAETSVAKDEHRKRLLARVAAAALARRRARSRRERVFKRRSFNLRAGCSVRFGDRVRLESEPGISVSDDAEIERHAEIEPFGCTDRCVDFRRRRAAREPSLAFRGRPRVRLASAARLRAPRRRLAAALAAAAGEADARPPERRRRRSVRAGWKRRFSSRVFGDFGDFGSRETLRGPRAGGRVASRGERLAGGDAGRSDVRLALELRERRDTLGVRSRRARPGTRHRAFGSVRAKRRLGSRAARLARRRRRRRRRARSRGSARPAAGIRRRRRRGARAASKRRRPRDFAGEPADRGFGRGGHARARPFRRRDAARVGRPPRRPGDRRGGRFFKKRRGGEGDAFGGGFAAKERDGPRSPRRETADRETLPKICAVCGEDCSRERRVFSRAKGYAHKRCVAFERDVSSAKTKALSVARKRRFSASVAANLFEAPSPRERESRPPSFAPRSSPSADARSTFDRNATDDEAARDEETLRGSLPDTEAAEEAETKLPPRRACFHCGDALIGEKGVKSPARGYAHVRCARALGWQISHKKPRGASQRDSGQSQGGAFAARKTRFAVKAAVSEDDVPTGEPANGPSPGLRDEPAEKAEATLVASEATLDLKKQGVLPMERDAARELEERRSSSYYGGNPIRGSAPNAFALRPRLAPPTVASLRASAASLGVPEELHAKVFYGDPRDAPARAAIVGGVPVKVPTNRPDDARAFFLPDDEMTHDFSKSDDDGRAARDVVSQNETRRRVSGFPRRFPRRRFPRRRRSRRARRGRRDESSSTSASVRVAASAPAPRRAQVERYARRRGLAPDPEKRPRETPATPDDPAAQPELVKPPPSPFHPPARVSLRAASASAAAGSGSRRRRRRRERLRRAPRRTRAWTPGWMVWTSSATPRGPLAASAAAGANPALRKSGSETRRTRTSRGSPAGTPSTARLRVRVLRCRTRWSARPRPSTRSRTGTSSTCASTGARRTRPKTKVSFATTQKTRRRALTKKRRRRRFRPFLPRRSHRGGASVRA